MPSRIEDYALIGDCEAAAPVARNGSLVDRASIPTLSEARGDGRAELETFVQLRRGPALAQCSQEMLAPRIEVIVRNDLKEHLMARPPLFQRHRECMCNGRRNGLWIVGVDEQRSRTFGRCPGEPR